MNSANDFYVFNKWIDAPSGAFGGRDGGSSIVPNDDKEAYWRIYTELLGAADSARAAHPDRDRLNLRPKNYSRERGSRGHRPVDLWVSICADGAEALGHMPQVYAIASQRGVEIGFAASIAEDDYFDVEAKERNRTIVPFINSKLPLGIEPISQALDNALGAQGGWHFNSKTRLIQGNHGFDEFASLGKMFDYLKAEGSDTGGGAACRVYKFEQLFSLDLEAAFQEALSLFAALLARCAPTPWDIQIRSAQIAVEDIDEPEPPPANAEEGRRRVLTEVARRQGQAKFRRKLLDAYNGLCAITGTNVSDVLQAAHIRPYNGPSTNHVTNGLLLRADLHTLFDLKLITINPITMRLAVSPRLQETIYWELNGREVARPSKVSMHPNVQALADHFKLATGGDGIDSP